MEMQKWLHNFLFLVINYFHPNSIFKFNLSILVLFVNFETNVKSNIPIFSNIYVVYELSIHPEFILQTASRMLLDMPGLHCRVLGMILDKLTEGDFQ